jgi:hypothetical protein
LLAAPVGAALSVAAVAYAYFPNPSDTTVTASVGAPEFTASAAPGSGLYPGAPPLTIPVTIRNTGGAPVLVTAIHPHLEDLPSSCPAAAWQVVVPSSLPTVAPSSAATVALTVTLAREAPAACEDATFDIPVTVEGVAR